MPQAKTIRYLTVAEVADYLRVTTRHVYRLCDNGTLDALRPGRRVLIHPDALRKMEESL